jgi:putative ABC transport system permease protein
MIRSYFKIALRILKRQKGLAFINVFGLSTGIACFSLLLLFATHEFSFDKFHKNASDIYRIYIHEELHAADNINANTDYSGPASETMGEAMKRELPDVVNYVRMQLPWGENLLRSDKNTSRISLAFADPSLFSVFDFGLKYGNKTTALHNLNDIVLTESRAKQIFGTDNVVGKTVQIQIGTTFQPFTVSAVARDIPANSTIRFDVLGTYLFAAANNGNFIIGNNWHPTVRQTYVQLRPASKLPGDARQLERFMETYEPAFVSNSKNYVVYMKNLGVNWTEKGMPESLRLQPLRAIHTDTSFNAWGFTDYAKIDPKIIWILLTIATGILMIACINFTTLAIGRSAGRSKEVGVRKVIGAEKQQVIFQFLTEALVISIASAVIGLILANLLLPWFNQLTGTDMHFSFIDYPLMDLLLVALAIIVGLLTGSYPAFVLSNFKPVEVLKNKISIGGSNLFTKSLVSFQFIISIMLIVSTIIILQQTKYLINKNPGFNKENVVAIDASQVDPNKVFPLFKQAALRYSQIIGVTSAAAGLGAGQDFLGYSDPGTGNFADINVIDADYLKVLGMQLVVGQNLRSSSLSDKLKPVIINETMMKAYGWTAQNAIGKEIKKFQGNTAIVTGVVRDFNYRSLSQNIKNQVFEISNDKGYSHFYVRINPGNPAPALAALEKSWGSILPGIPMKYSFLDTDVNNYYNAEQRWTSLIGMAGGISIFLACLGLLGLATLAAINRTKEIGVRKVLGASVASIITLLSKDLIKLIIISFTIASPLAWYCMSKWLQDYATHISIGWSVFALAGSGAILIALITISFQSIKAAIANPVKSLRMD